MPAASVLSPAPANQHTDAWDRYCLKTYSLRHGTPPYIAGDRVFDPRYPADMLTVLRCERVGDGWSVSWRADPVIEGVRPVTGCCPAERLMPAAALWMASEPVIDTELLL